MNAYPVFAVYCALAALCGGVSHWLPLRSVLVFAAVLVVGLVGVDVVVFGSPDPWLALRSGSSVIAYVGPRLVFLSVLTAIPIALGRGVGPWVSRLARQNEFQGSTLRPVLGGLILISLGWLTPALVAWRFTGEAARQIASGERGFNSFPYEAAAADLNAIAWWWALTAAVAWALGIAVYLRWQRVP